MYWEDGGRVLAAPAWLEPSSTWASPRLACRPKPLFSSCWWCRSPCCSGRRGDTSGAGCSNCELSEIDPSRPTSLASYFLLLVPPAAFTQWSSAATGAVCVCSGERQQLLDGATEEEEWERRTPGGYRPIPALRVITHKELWDSKKKKKRQSKVFVIMSPRCNFS